MLKDFLIPLLPDEPQNFISKGKLKNIKLGIKVVNKASKNLMPRQTRFMVPFERLTNKHCPNFTSKNAIKEKMLKRL